MGSNFTAITKSDFFGPAKSRTVNSTWNTRTGNKKILGRQPKIKDKTLLEFMEAKTKEGRHIVPENIARDLKNELGVDCSLSGMRNATHRLNYTCQDCGIPASNGYVSEFLMPCGELTPL